MIEPKEIIKEVKSALDKDIKISILEHTAKQDDKNSNLFAAKEIEHIVRWIVRITTGALVAGLFAIVISRVISFI